MSSFPTISGWYYLRWGSTPTSTPDLGTGAWTGLASNSGCTIGSQCGAQGCCGITFTTTDLGPNEVPLYVDADSKRLGVALEAGIPPGHDNYLWINPLQGPACAQVGLSEFDFTPFDIASSWFINGQGELTNGIAKWSPTYGTIYCDCTGGSVYTFPSFVPTPGPAELTPSKSGWYYLRPQTAHTYLTLQQGQLYLSANAANELMFYYDTVSRQVGVELPQPFAPALASTTPQWLNPVSYASCSTSSLFQLSTFSQLVNPGWIMFADGVMRDVTHRDNFWTSSGVNSPITMYCGPPGSAKSNLVLQFSAVPAVGNSVLEVLGQVMRPVVKGTPDYELCQGGSDNGDNQTCFYNHSPLDPNTPIFPEINPNPNAVLGYSQQTLAQGYAIQSGQAPTVYLQQPNDAMQLNSMQASICFDENCNCPGESPQQCATSPDKYCHCDAGGQDTTCGLSCAPGLTPVRVGACKYQPLKGFYLSNYQCFPMRVYGVVGDQNSHSCVEYAGPNPPAGQIYASMQACTEQWADCPAGYQRFPQLDRPGCYRKGDYQQNSNFACDSGFYGDCDCGTGHCKATGWSSNCHGPKDGCVGNSCSNDCGDILPVPPWGYFCADSDSSYGNVWVQNKSDQPMAAPFDNANFRAHPNPQKFCVPGVTKYAN